MTKKELIKALSSNLNQPVKEVQKIIELTFDTIIDQLEKGESVRIVGFGEFKLRPRSARKGRNPHTGVSMMIPETVTPVFTPGSVLLERVKD